MKKIYGFAALCAAMTLASCSNNDEPIAPVNQGGNTTAEIGGYLSVNIANTNKETRAAHNNYEYGTPAESRATVATFLFFDKDGNQIGMSAQQALTSTNAPGAAAPNVERDYTVMVPVNVDLTQEEENDKNNLATTIKGKVDKIDRVVVILNPTTGNDGIDATVKGLSEPEVLKVAADYSTLTSANGFVMTNSVYYKTKDANGIDLAPDQKDFVYGQDVKGKIKASQLEATQNPVDLYVERVVARVDVNYDNGFTITDRTGDKAVKIWGYEEEGGKKIWKETATDLYIKVTGVEVANVANQSYLVKNLNDSYKSEGRFSAWNDESNFRSHWAYSWTKGLTDNGDKGNDVMAPSRLVDEEDQGKIASTWFKNQSYDTFKGSWEYDATKSIANQKKVKFYVNENTNELYKTALVVSAQLCDADGEGVTFFRTEKDGRYYTEEGVTNVLLDMLKREGYYVKTGEKKVIKEDGTEVTENTYRNIDKDDLHFISAVKSSIKPEDAKGYEGYLEFNAAPTTPDGNQYFTDADVYRTTDGGVTFDEVDSFTEKVLHSKNYKVWKWNKGVCYYYVYLTNQETETIEVDDENITVPIDGVVRNHIYQVVIDGISGLGVPVFDPEDVIVPVTPEKLTPSDDWSLACNIHILSWVRYTQHANFDDEY